VCHKFLCPVCHSGLDQACPGLDPGESSFLLLDPRFRGDDKKDLDPRFRGDDKKDLDSRSPITHFEDKLRGNDGFGINVKNI